MQPGCHTLICRWNPAAGKLYQNYYRPGYIFADKPAYPREYYPGRKYGEHERINHGDIFMFIGGPGSKQRCPRHYVAYKVLWGERLGWLIYPEQFNTHEDRPVDPIRL